MERLLLLLLFSGAAAFLLTRLLLRFRFAELALALLKAAVTLAAVAYVAAFAVFYRPEAWWPILVEMAEALAGFDGTTLGIAFAAAAGAIMARTTQRRPPAEPEASPKTGGKRLAGLLALTAAAVVLAGCIKPVISAQADNGTGAEPDLAGSPERLRDIVVANQIVFQGSAAAPEPVCRCGPKLYLSQIARPMVNAVVAIEDRRFFRHRGIDPNGVIRAGLRMVWSLGRRVEGASTIPQQLIKNTVLTGDRESGRKWAEWRLAWALQGVMNDQDVLAAYLNQMIFAYDRGRPVVGVENAARFFFGRRAAELSLRESALLAGLLKAPSAYNPLVHPERAKRRAALVLAAMAAQGMISKDEALKARPRARGPLKPIFAETRSFVQWVLADIREQNPGLAFDRTTRIPLTLEVQTQAQAEDALEGAMGRVRALRSAEAGFLTMGLDGRVVAMIGQRDFGRRQLNFVTQTRRQPASTMKSFVFASAFEAGFLKPLPPLLAKFAVSDRDSAVTAAKQVGVEKITEIAHRLGIGSALAGTATSLALGGSEVTLFELTRAYAPFANQGLAVKPFGHWGIVQGWRLIAWHKSEGRRVLAPEVAGAVHSMLRAVVEQGTGWPARAIKAAAGKTGTNGESGDEFNRDAWFIGMTDRHLSGLWIGRPDNAAMLGVKGSTAAQVWAAVEKSLPTK